MNVFLHKSLATVMAMLVLFTTLSFTVDMHYCGGSLVEMTVIGQLEGCGMEKAPQSVICEAPSMTQSSCCSDQHLSVQGQNELQLTFDKLSFEQQVFIASFVYSYHKAFENFDNAIVGFKDYSPPPLIRDVQVMDQSFLI